MVKLMKTKYLDIAIFVTFLLFVGLILTSNHQLKINNKISITARYTAPNEEYYVEVLGVIYPRDVQVELSAENQEKLNTINDANLNITMDLYGGKKYIAPSRVELTGEVNTLAGKTYFYYNGYVTTPEGEYQEFNEIVVCDLVLNPNIFDFKLDD